MLSMDTIGVTGVKSASVQADGSWIDHDLFAGSEVKAAGADGFASGNDYDVATVNGIIVAAEEVDSNSKDILFVAQRDKYDAALGESTGTVDAKVYFTDGKSDVVTVNKLEGKKLASSAGEKYTAESTFVPGLYTYTVSGGQYSLKAINGNNKAGYDDYGTGVFNPDQGKYGATSVGDDAVIFTGTKVDAAGDVPMHYTDVSVISGEKLKKFEDDSVAFDSLGYLMDKVSGIKYVMVATALSSTEVEFTSDQMYAYVIDSPYETQIKDGEEDVDVWAIPVWNGEEQVVLYAEPDEYIRLVKGDAFGYELSDDDLYSVNLEKATMTAITGFQNKSEGLVEFYALGEDTVLTYNKDNKAWYGDYDSTLGTEGKVSIEMDEDVVFIGINSDNYASCETITGNNVKTVSYDEVNDVVAANSYIMTNNDGSKVLAIFFDTNNSLVNKEKGDPIYLCAAE